VTETRRITFQGSDPLARTLTQMLEKEGVTVQVTRSKPATTEHQDSPARAGDLPATLMASGTLKDIQKGVRKFRMRFPGAAKVIIDDEPDLSRGPIFHRGRLG